MRRRLAALLAPLAIAACAGPTAGGLFDERITNVTIDTTYTRVGFNAFAAAGPRIEIAGSIPGGATPEELAASLRLPGFFPQTPFRVLDPEERGRGRRIVLVFGAFGAPNAIATCRRGADGGAVTRTLEVAAVYCVGGDRASDAKLSHAAPLVPGDPEFTASMRRMFQLMFPVREERFRDDEDCPPFSRCN